MNVMIQLYIYDGTERIQNPDLTQAEFDAEVESRRQHYISRLWDAAHAYEFSEINGTGAGLLAVGVMRKLPKAMAIQAWVTSLWALYYQRKPLVTHEMGDELLDFSQCGPMPHTIPELMAEVLG